MCWLCGETAWFGVEAVGDAIPRKNQSYNACSGGKGGREGRKVKAKVRSAIFFQLYSDI